MTLGVGLVAGAAAVAATLVTGREVDAGRAWWAGLLWLLLALPWAVPS